MLCELDSYEKASLFPKNLVDGGLSSSGSQLSHHLISMQGCVEVIIVVSKSIFGDFETIDQLVSLSTFFHCIWFSFVCIS